MLKLSKIADAAELLDVSEARAYELVRLGLIPGVVRIGRQIRIDLEELEGWIKQGGRSLAGGWRREPERGEPVSVEKHRLSGTRTRGAS